MTLYANDEARLTADVVTEFLSAIFGGTESPIFFQTLANDPGDADEAPNKQKVLTRDVAAIERFIARHDRSRRGLFFCVSTIALGSPTRNKDNCAEICVAHTDLDFRSIEQDEPAIRRVADTLPCPPSAIVFSGGGLHLYWLLKEPLDAQLNRDRIEALNRGLAAMLAGDAAATDVCRLMRLPGTTNSKHGDQRRVTVERLDATARYDLEELEEWVAEARSLLSPKVAEPTKTKGMTPRKTKGSNRTLQGQTENPYLKVAEEQGWKPPLDVGQMLMEMTYPGNVHDTQIRVSASLLKAGQDVETVVATLLEATRVAAGPGGLHWDWKAEEKVIREACAGAQRKFALPDDAYASPPGNAPGNAPDTPDQGNTPDTVAGKGAPIGEPDGVREGVTPEPVDNVVPFSTAERKDRAKSRKTKSQKANSAHIVLAQAVMTVLESRGHRLLFTEAGPYRYRDGLWHWLDDRTLKGWLDTALEEGARGLKLESTTRLISEARNYIIRSPDLQMASPPFDRHGMVPTASGLFCPIKRTLLLSAPEHYCTWQIPFEYRPEAICPMWERMLDDAFADRPPAVRAQYIALLQEMLGMGLVDIRAKALSRAAIFQGTSNCGKSDMIEVMAGLFGPRHNTTPLDRLDTNHGLMTFVKRLPWVLHEAFDQTKWHLSSTVKSIISCEQIQINVKNGGIFSHAPTGPVFWGTNNPPQFKEATSAITNRVVIVECRRKFDEDHPVGAAVVARTAGLAKPSQLVLATEMEGVLAWAIDGLLRAQARGYYLIPNEAKAAAEEVRKDSNIVAGFLDVAVDYHPDSMVSVPDFSAAFASWWAEHKGSDRGVPASDSVGRALKALGEPRVAIDLGLRDMHRRYYAGVRLNTEGLRYWRNAVTSEAYLFQSRKASTSGPEESPNRDIPGSWWGRSAIEAMRLEHEKRMTLLKDTF